MNGNELFNRFCKLLASKEMSKSEFCKKTGIKQNVLSNWGSRGTMPSADLALAIAEGLDVSVDFILGKSDIPNPEIKNDLSFEEINLIEAYRNANPEQKRMIVEMLAFFKSQKQD